MSRILKTEEGPKNEGKLSKMRKISKYFQKSKKWAKFWKLGKNHQAFVKAQKQSKSRKTEQTVDITGTTKPTRSQKESLAGIWAVCPFGSDYHDGKTRWKINWYLALETEDYFLSVKSHWVRNSSHLMGKFCKVSLHCVV